MAVNDELRGAGCPAPTMTELTTVGSSRMTIPKHGRSLVAVVTRLAIGSMAVLTRHWVGSY